MKKKYRNLFIGLGFPISSILALSMISCKKNETSEEKPNNSNDAENIEPGWSFKSDTKPEEVNQFSINHLQKLHFNYPNYKGDLVTLKADGEPTFNYPGDPNTPTGPFQFAKKGIIPTEKHLELSKRVFSVTLTPLLLNVLTSFQHWRQEISKKNLKLKHSLDRCWVWLFFKELHLMTSSFSPCMSMC